MEKGCGGESERKALASDEGENQDGGRKAVPDDLEPPPPTLGINEDDSDDSDGDMTDHLTRGVVGRVSAFLGGEEKSTTKRAGKSTRVVLTIRQLRRIMTAKESLFKFGTFVPRSERGAGVVCVEESYGIGQYDVPQAFLKAFIDFDIFVYPPRGQAEFEGQILKLRRALYGGKQSAYLWYTMMNEFILELGFVASALDRCLYRREDAILVLFCDDLRIGASDAVLEKLYSSFYAKFGITTAPGDRFLGMDTHYQRDRGIMKLSMESYITTTMERFRTFDTGRGYPYRELVGCLLWITLCVMGPELLRVKDLARRANKYTEEDYREALKVLKRVYARKEYGIVIARGAAGKELVPSSSRTKPAQGETAGDGSDATPHPYDDTGILIGGEQNELLQ
jgi:hypothetical protein